MELSHSLLLHLRGIRYHTNIHHRYITLIYPNRVKYVLPLLLLIERYRFCVSPLSLMGY